MRTGIRSTLAVVVLSLASSRPLPAQSEQERILAVKKQIQESPLFDFGKVKAGQPVEHTFPFHNPGPDALEVKTIQLTSPLTVTKINRVVKPGDSGSITVRLGTPRKTGDFEGIVIVQFAKEGVPNRFFRLEGRVVNPIDFDPIPAFFLTTFAGESVEQSVEITNYEDEPLEILKLDHDSARFSAEVSTLEAGRKFRLTVKASGKGTAGKAQEVLGLVTSSKTQPLIRIPVNTQVRQRVYTFPDSLVLGLIDTASLKKRPKDVSFLSQSITVYQRNGTNFQIAAETDVPFLGLTKRQAHLKDRFELQLSVIPEKLKGGPFKGTVRITTNDAEFPLLEIPITCRVTEDW